MKKSDWSTGALIAEALDILILLVYMVSQVCYGLLYKVQIYQIILNLLVAVLVYAGLTVLAMYPERLNNLPEKVCIGRVRVYSLRMLRGIKLVFLLGLLIPCICDLVAVDLPAVYNACLILGMFAIAVYYEVRILLQLRNQGNERK